MMLDFVYYQGTLLALRTAGKTVTLILCRPEPGILPPLLFLVSIYELWLEPLHDIFPLINTLTVMSNVTAWNECFPVK